MTTRTLRQTPTHDVPTRAPRKRHWRRWVLGGCVVVVALIVTAGVLGDPQPAPPPLALPTAAAGAPVGPLTGGWEVAAGSAAGFRVQETFVGMSDDTVGRTSGVTGRIALSGSRITSARFNIDLAAMKVGGKAQPQFATSLDTKNHPKATFALTEPTRLDSAFTSGGTITSKATGQLAIHGVSKLVTFTVSSRRDGAALQIAGSIPVAFSNWGITGPKGYGSLGSLADHGKAEFLLVLHRH